MAIAKLLERIVWSLHEMDGTTSFARTVSYAKESLTEGEKSVLLTSLY
jgi:hypothetical protein